jgi:hypothetical protein
MAQDFYKQGGSYFTTSGQKVANPTELQNLAKAGGKEIAMPSVPTGATKIASPDQLKGLTEKDIFRQGQDIYRLPTINTTLDAEQVSPDVPEPEAVNDVSSYTAGLDTTIKGLEENIKKINEPLPQEQEISEIRKRQGELSEQKAQVQETALPKAEEFGYTKYTKELQSILPQIASLKAQYDNAEIAQEGRVGSAASIYGRQALIQRQRAIELQGLSAIAQAYQGNIQLATQTAKDMIDMELAPIQTRIDDQKWQIEQVYEQLTSAEQKKADSLNLVLAERERLLEEEKERKMNIANIGLVAAQNGADQATIEKIMNAKTYGEAIINSGQYLKTSTGTNWDTFVDEKTGETRLINKKTGEVVNPGQSDVANGILVDGSGQAYDIASYATDPNHEINVQNALNKIGKFYTIEDIDAYIKGESPESPITGEMIANASEKYGVSWEMMAAIIKADSNFADPRMNDQGQISDKGARQRAYRTMNPGNVGNVDSGANVQMNSWQDGVDAVAKNLAWRKTTVQPTPTVDPEIQSYVDLVSKGELTELQALQQVTDDKKDKLVIALSSIVSPTDTTQDLVAKEKAQLALTLKDHKGLKNAVGTIALGRKAPFQWGQKADFINSIEQLVSDLSLESLIEAKERGATFGALTDREMKILASAATTIGNMRQYDKNGNVTGYKSTESRFKEELDKISKIFLRGIKGNIENMEITSPTIYYTETSTPITSGTTSSGIKYTITE